MGMVYDKDSGDIILVGLAASRLPVARFDDLVVALRARLIYNKFPLVSIDPDEETERTKVQKVRFVGHLEDTSFGNDFLKCDVFLKRYSLHQEKTIPAIQPYTTFLEEDIKADVERAGAKVLGIAWKYGTEHLRRQPQYREMRVATTLSYQARFWFCVSEPYNAVCRPTEMFPEVFVIKELRACLKSQLVKREGAKRSHAAPERYCASWTEHHDEMCEHFPALKRLKQLYDFVAVADAIAHVKEHGYLDSFLRRHRTETVQTPRSKSLEELCGVVERTDGRQHLVRVSGGIQIRPEIKYLNMGNVWELHSIVLRSRPTPKSLTWPLPLDGWRTPNAQDLDLGPSEVPKTADNPRERSLAAGCYVHSESVLLEPSNAAPSSSGRQFSSFLAPRFTSSPLPSAFPTYYLNGVLVDPNVVKDATPLPASVRESTKRALEKSKGPAVRIDIKPLEFEKP